MSANSDLPGHSFERPTPAALLTLASAPIQQGPEKLSGHPTIGVSDLAGMFNDDLTLRGICEQAYRMRDAEIQSEDR